MESGAPKSFPCKNFRGSTILLSLRREILSHKELFWFESLTSEIYFANISKKFWAVPHNVSITWALKPSSCLPVHFLIKKYPVRSLSPGKKTFPPSFALQNLHIRYIKIHTCSNNDFSIVKNGKGNGRKTSTLGILLRNIFSFSENFPLR